MQYTFAEPLVRYEAVEDLTRQFPDDLLRGSPCLPAARLLEVIKRDAEATAQVTHEIFGGRVSGLLGLNPGAAIGRLRVVRSFLPNGPVRPSCSPSRRLGTSNRAA